MNMFMYKTGCGYFRVRERGVPKVLILAQYTKRNTMPSSREEKQRGSLIVLEGCDHSGKTTQCKKLVCALNEAGIKTKAMRFPGDYTIVCQEDKKKKGRGYLSGPGQIAYTSYIGYLSEVDK